MSTVDFRSRSSQVTGSDDAHNPNSNMIITITSVLQFISSTFKSMSISKIGNSIVEKSICSSEALLIMYFTTWRSFVVNWISGLSYELLMTRGFSRSFLDVVYDCLGCFGDGSLVSSKFDCCDEVKIDCRDEVEKVVKLEHNVTKDSKFINGKRSKPNEYESLMDTGFYQYLVNVTETYPPTHIVTVTEAVRSAALELLIKIVEAQILRICDDNIVPRVISLLDSALAFNASNDPSVDVLTKICDKTITGCQSTENAVALIPAITQAITWALCNTCASLQLLQGLTYDSYATRTCPDTIAIPSMPPACVFHDEFALVRALLHLVRLHGSEVIDAILSLNQQVHHNKIFDNNPLHPFDRLAMSISINMWGILRREELSPTVWLSSAVEVTSFEDRGEGGGAVIYLLQELCTSEDIADKLTCLFIDVWEPLRNLCTRHNLTQSTLDGDCTKYSAGCIKKGITANLLAAIALADNLRDLESTSVGGYVVRFLFRCISIADILKNAKFAYKSLAFSKPTNFSITHSSLITPLISGDEENCMSDQLDLYSFFLSTLKNCLTSDIRNENDL